MEAGKYQELKAMTTPQSIYKLTESTNRHFEVGVGYGEMVLYAAETTVDGQLIEWMPKHPFVDRFKYASLQTYRCEKPVYQYTLGPV